MRKTMKLLSKSSIDIAQLQARKKIGAEHIELQLLDDFLAEDLNLPALVEEIYQTGCIIHNVHAPLLQGIELELPDFLSGDKNILFHKVCSFSQLLAEKYKHPITIIIHNSISINTYKKLNNSLEVIVNFFNDCIEQYPCIQFSIENLIPVIIKEKLIIGSEVFLDENVHLVHYLNHACKRPIFYTTLDTCHLFMTLKTLQALHPIHSFELDYFFDKYKDTVNNIHLCNLKNMGYQKGDHGCAFNRTNESDMELLKELLDLYRKYKLDAYLTIEVYEEDYLRCDNLIETRKAIEMLDLL